MLLESTASSSETKFSAFHLDRHKKTIKKHIDSHMVKPSINIQLSTLDPSFFTGFVQADG